MSEVKYPEVTVKLTGKDGNAFAVLGAVRGALVKAKVPVEEIAKFISEATAGDYDDLVQTCMSWVNVE